MSALHDASFLKLLLLVLSAASALIAVPHALLHNRDSRAAWGWIAACLLYPLAGAFLYYIFGAPLKPSGLMANTSQRS